ncbi:hypothetical protein E2493_01285 [Sphingomonas parva]|uniref:Lipoprotein n=1 Tax=Sphingomonas parva TaxID=2555898 RepID=A0A4Y8ZVG8_9SPHN|nr:hypothetical protein [Sphingomonas parva]TFI59914.1 hypothetical protein E2493_01285 [Sphingomonas parva]
MELRLVGRAAIISGFVLLAGCDPAPEVPADGSINQPLPASICTEATKSLETLSKSGSFEYDREGNATLQQDIWLQLGSAGQNQLTQALAFAAACATGKTPREQQVLVRADDGRTLSNRTVEIAPDTDLLFDQDR